MKIQNDPWENAESYQIWTEYIERVPEDVLDLIRSCWGTRRCEWHTDLIEEINETTPSIFDISVEISRLRVIWDVLDLRKALGFDIGIYDYDQWWNPPPIPGYAEIFAAYKDAGKPLMLSTYERAIIECARKAAYIMRKRVPGDTQKSLLAKRPQHRGFGER